MPPPLRFQCFLASLAMAMALLAPGCSSPPSQGIPDSATDVPTNRDADAFEPELPEPSDDSTDGPDLTGADQLDQLDQADPSQDLAVPDGTGPTDADDSAAPDDSASDDSDSPDPDDTGPDSADVDAGTTCPEAALCTLQGYIPPCFEGRCNARNTCVATRIPECCTFDADCPQTGGLSACEAVRCVARVCTALPVPGCCTSDLACDDGLPQTVDQCLPDAARCRHCAPACPNRAPTFERRFDTDEPLPAQGFTTIDPQPNDQVTWVRSTRRAASGTGALYLGNPRCHTYYGGSLGLDCTPGSAEQQDSQRVSPTLATAYFNLPADTPTVATFMVWSQVEPLLGRGDAEPDILRVLVEPVASPTWRLASTLSLGKSTEWAPLAVDLAPWRGQTIRLRFEFDTFDGQNNVYEGVWIDELVVAPACAGGGCCESDATCPPVSGCATSLCLRFADGDARVCASLPLTPGEPCRACTHVAECNDENPCTTDTCMTSPAGPGSCGNVAFCCLERDVFTADFDTNLLPFAPTSISPDPTDPAVRWQLRDGRAWFGDVVTSTYASPIDLRVAGTIASPPIALPTAITPGQTLALTLTLRLSTEWDPTPPATFDNPSALDRLVIEVVDGALVTPLWSSDQIAGSTRGSTLPLAFDLSRWIGRNVIVRFHFDSGDGEANHFEGPLIDDVAVGLRCR